MSVSYKQAKLAEQWDAIVIGSGIGGLTAAVLLGAHGGKRVLVLERHYAAGGFTHTFRRPGYERDVGLHYIGQMQDASSPVRRAFDREVAVDALADVGQRGAEEHHALVLVLVADLAPTRMIAALLAAAGVPSGGLQVAIRAGADPYAAPRGRDDQRADALERVSVAHGRAVGIAVAEAFPTALTADSGARIGDVSKACGFGGFGWVADDFERHWTGARGARFTGLGLHKGLHKTFDASGGRRLLPYNRRIVTLDFLGSLQRTGMCGELRAEDAGRDVVLMGWVNRRRDHGGLIFLDVRDRTGITQVVVGEQSGEAHAKADAARPEFVVAVKGRVRQRADGLENPNMVTGEIEVVAEELLLLNEAKTPPFSPSEEAIANEEVRLKYRYLDLRRAGMQENFALRSRVAMAIRNYLVGEGFLEIETPFMTRSTPEGARDYLVPSRVHAGQFYALPQSPQIFKQILMISGFDKYFQVARCFRDEDLRADRQPEFTQIDLEMSFPQQETIFRVAEGFLTAAFAAANVRLKTPFMRMTYDDAIKNYGIDKPDMRLPAMVSLSDLLTVDLRTKLRIEQELPVLGFVIPGVGELSGTARKALLSEVRGGFGDCGLDLLDVARLKTNAEFAPLAEAIAARLRVGDCTLSDGAAKDGAPGLSSELETPGLTSQGPKSEPGAPGVSTSQGPRSEPGAPGSVADLVVVVTPKLGTPAMWNFDPQWIWKRVGALRLQLGAKYAERHGRFEKTGTAEDFKFCWVTDFPMYEWDEETKVWNAAHHPFTSPHEDDIAAGRLTNDKGAVRALAYDIVLNGTELGSGSIRIHRQDVQAEIFRSLGMTDAEAHERFGFFLDALEYGTPPHGGIALGLDRIVMILAGATSLREVIAFPKTAKAIDLMVDAPTPVSEQQLRELHLRVR